MNSANEAADSRWWQNRANRYAEQVENLQAEVAYQTAVVDRVREVRDAWAKRLPENQFEDTQFHRMVGALTGALDGEASDA